MKKAHLKTRHALLMSMISLMTCFAMLVGATFAWFTDSVTSGVNRIVAGNLDVEVYHKTSGTGTTNPEEKVDGTTKLFTKDINGNDLLWEPEVIAYESFDVRNVGSLALKYALQLNNVGYNYVDGTGKWLGEVIKVAVTKDAPANRDAAKALFNGGSKTLEQFASAPVVLPDTLNGYLTAGTAAAPTSEKFTVVLYWPQSAADNNWNLGNINGVNVTSNDGNPLYVNLGITLVATQKDNESDSFSNTYDASADTADVEDKWAGVSVAVPATTLSSSNTTDTIKDLTLGSTATLGGVAATIPNAPAQTVTNDTGTNTTTTVTTTYELTVEPVASNTEATFTVDESNSAAHFDIDLTQYTTTVTQVGTADPTSVDSEKTDYSGNELIEVKLNIGQVDLQKFYHKDKQMSLITDESGKGDGKYMYDSNTGILTLWTKTFSPFTEIHKFAGGLGTEEHPYLLANYEQLVNIDVGIGDRYPEEGTDTVYYKLINDIDVAAHDGSNGIHGDLDGDPRTFVLDLNEKTVMIGNKPLFDCASHMEVSNGTINYTGTGAPFVNYACYQNVDSYIMNFYDLTLTGSINENSYSHFGPLVAYAFGINSGNGEFIAENITNNLTINSNNSTGYVGGLFGYVQGTAVSATVRNCTFNGTISAAYAGGFINTCSAPKAGVTSSGNEMNGTLLGAITAIAFGCNGNITGGSAALNELNNSVKIGDGALMNIVSPATNLFELDENNQVIIKDKDGVTSYRAAVMFMVNSVANGTGGYPRYITRDITDNDSLTYETGVYKLSIQTMSTDGSTTETLVSNNNGTVIWRNEDAYCYYSADYILSNNRATVYVYGYNDDGQVVTYQTLPYTY